MSLPKLESPKYEAKLPSTGKKFTYRPYLVKEEKILMLAMESGETKQIMQAVKDAITSCTFGKVNADDIAVFDLEYIFMKLRSKSVGEVSKVNVTCEKCEKKTTVEVNLEEIDVDMKAAPTTKIKLTDKIGVIMRWPKVDMIAEIADKTPEQQKEAAFDIITECIESIYDDKKVYPTSDSTKEERLEFIESLNQTQFKLLQNFIENMPKLEHKIDFACEHCKAENSVTVKGLKNFF